MRKSTNIRLVLLGSAGLLLTACDDGPPADAAFFADVASCAAVHSEADCRTAFGQSQQAALEEAPKFQRTEDCEAEFGAGNCEVRESSAGSFIMPMLMGYMMASAFNRPVFRGPGNSAVMPSGGKTYNVGNFAGGSRVAAFQPAAPTQVQRGGFGRSASGFSSPAGG